MYRQIDRTKTMWADFRSTTDPMLDPYEVLIDRVQQLDLELQTVTIELESKSEQTRQLWRQHMLMLESLPLGAMLIDRTGCIRMANQKAKELLHLGNQAIERQLLQSVWNALGLPNVPFAVCEHRGRMLKCWETVMDEPGKSSCETIRFIQEVTQEEQRDCHEPLVALGEMVGQIAHDIRNPLGSIELFAHLLGQNNQDAEERQYLGAHLSTSVRSLDQLLSNLLTFAKPQQPNMKDVCVRSLLDEVEMLAFQQLRANSITLKRMIDEDAELIQADEGLLRQACLNLLLNAIQASSKGGVIEFECRRESYAENSPQSLLGNERVVLRIRDYGWGIPKNDVSKVFDPFFSKREGGTGLGLSIVRQVMETHRGKIDLSSEEGLGTMVSLSIPLKRRPE